MDGIMLPNPQRDDDEGRDDVEKEREREERGRAREVYARVTQKDKKVVAS